VNLTRYDVLILVLASMVMIGLCQVARAETLHHQAWNAGGLLEGGDVNLWRVTPTRSWQAVPADEWGLTAWEEKRYSELRWGADTCVKLQGRVIRREYSSNWSAPVTVPRGCSWEAPTPVPEPPAWAGLGAGSATLALLRRARSRA